ncbi:thiamine pyrophosphate-dependent enzyme [Petrotoga olearia]|uniref:Pyruvate ferredoxin oxidoreductase subunit beta n=2 Tax=Petrotoga olearia TaxID=156203 RepID=A0A2K1P137_9BACT|nr:thiamine pyrophosphate-dependent enzyme [Petrotoga olearia]KUK14951.1 MAG: Thiamine pyrophosphate protein domain protein TPP-binding [Petrotoga mobilis]PNR96499.1 pyruvate ferredoxin oxidoreductase subunit beta [Petrotoga olearia DSM 13574]RMA76413.1 pyruvate ferredoxin oxidoreductase beta subunit [Petrotoga olearia]HBT51334.1 pyruvate ferredoxin oxidoreductase [Petrotoga sp.]
MPSIRDIVGYVETNDWAFTQGHRLCPGCNAPMVANWATLAAKSLGYEPVVGAATGCLEVSSTIYPFTSWNVPYIHNAFENVAATISGAESAYRSLLNRGKIKNDKIKFIAFAGDGGTYDIGLQSLSGAIERGHDFVYILYDNEGYMNTGNQRSGSTPIGADSTTEPVGKAISGKLQLKKSIVDIIAGHEGVYAATAVTSEPWDFIRKMQSALEFKGPAFISILAPCVRFWRIPDDSGPEVTKLAVETKYWPLWEYNMGVYKVTKKPKIFKPVKDYVTKLGRYNKLMKRPDANEILEELQNYVDAKWDRLLALEEITKDKPIRTKI